MKYILLDKTHSTQDYLKSLLESEDSQQSILVSTQYQARGIGRQGKKWEFIAGSLACSFTLKPNPNLLLTSLEIAILCHQFIKKELNISLQFKWPNDLFYQNKKCGGIIIHSFKDTLVVGVGINNSFYSSKNESKQWKIGLPLKKNMAPNLYDYVLNHRIENAELIKSYWEKHCFHLNQKVQIENEVGFFLGLGQHGQAQLKQEDNSIKLFHSGSLRLIL